MTEWATTGKGLASSSFYDAVAFFSTGLGDLHTHDAQIGLLACGYTPDIWRHLFRVEPADYFADPDAALSPSAQTVVVLPNPVQPHSEGEVCLVSSDVGDAPRIDLNYLADPHDVTVMVAVMRRALEIVDHWPGDGLGSLMVPPALAEAHGHTAGDRAERRPAGGPGPPLRADRLSRDVDLPDGQRRRRGAARARGGRAPRGRRQHHADGGERQHQCRHDHDRGAGGGADRRGARAHAGEHRRLTSTLADPTTSTGGSGLSTLCRCGRRPSVSRRM